MEALPDFGNRDDYIQEARRIIALQREHGLIPDAPEYPPMTSGERPAVLSERAQRELDAIRRMLEPCVNSPIKGR